MERTRYNKEKKMKSSKIMLMSKIPVNNKLKNLPKSK